VHYSIKKSTELHTDESSTHHHTPLFSDPPATPTSRFLNTNLYEPLISPMRATFPDYFILILARNFCGKGLHFAVSSILHRVYAMTMTSYNKLHGVKSQKIAPLRAITVRSSNIKNIMQRGKGKAVPVTDRESP
jgi:hypothetical protein